MPEVEPALRLAPLLLAPKGFQQRVRRQGVHVVRAMGQEDETKMRTAAMILSRTGRDGDPPLGRGQSPWASRDPMPGPHLSLASGVGAGVPRMP